MKKLLSLFQNSDHSEDDLSVSEKSVDIEMIHTNESVYELRIVHKINESIMEHFETILIREELNDTTTILFIKFEVGEYFNGLSSSKSSQLSHKCINKSVVLLFESHNLDKCFIYWKSKNISYFLSYDFRDQRNGVNVEEFNGFIVNFIINSLKRGFLGLHHYYTTHNSAVEVHLNYFADSRGYNLLHLAAESGKTQLVKVFLNSDIRTPTALKNKKSAQELAWNGQHFDTLLVLLKSNLTYPTSFDVNKCPEEIKNFYKISLEMHQAVYSKNIEKIVEIIEKNPTLCHFYNCSNESAPKIALNCKYMDIYKLLLTNKIFLGRHETFNETWENFTNNERTILREIHFKHSMYLPEKYLNDFTINSRVAHDDPNVNAKRKLIEYAFDVLNANPMIQIILMMVAASKNFQILFDFCRNSVHLLDPTANFTIKGLFYSSGRIYISAWLLMFESTENQTFGTLAHELCHYAMKLTFRNVAKPYHRTDRKARENFDKILKICHEKSGKEPIIDLVFEEYPEKDIIDLKWS